MSKFLKSAKMKLMVMMVSVVSTMAVTVGAESTSLLPAEATTIISDFAGQIVPTVISLITIIVPVGLTCWAIGFGVKKGISVLQRRASKAL